MPLSGRRVLILITARDTGTMTVDVRGPYSDRDSIIIMLDEARKLVEQGNFGTSIRRREQGR
jgi:hypothetical protein